MHCGEVARPVAREQTLLNLSSTYKMLRLAHAPVAVARRRERHLGGALSLAQLRGQHWACGACHFVNDGGRTWNSATATKVTRPRTRACEFARLGNSHRATRRRSSGAPRRPVTVVMRRCADSASRTKQGRVHDTRRLECLAADHEKSTRDQRSKHIHVRT